MLLETYLFLLLATIALLLGYAIIRSTGKNLGWLCCAASIFCLLTLTWSSFNIEITHCDSVVNSSAQTYSYVGNTSNVHSISTTNSNSILCQTTKYNESSLAWVFGILIALICIFLVIDLTTKQKMGEY
jgi:carbon starvation protein CstA